MPLSIFEKILVGTLLVMGGIALCFEPLFYLNHQRWNQGEASQLGQLVVSVWDVYNAWDPIFADPPLWLKVMCWIEVLVFGPLYLFSAFVISRRQSRLLRTVVLPFSGALLYSTVVYFALECLDPLPGTNLPMVFLINCPWTLLPIAIFFLACSSSSSSKKHR